LCLFPLAGPSLRAARPTSGRLFDGTDAVLRGELFFFASPPSPRPSPPGPGVPVTPNAAAATSRPRWKAPPRGFALVFWKLFSFWVPIHAPRAASAKLTVFAPFLALRRAFPPSSRSPPWSRSAKGSFWVWTRLGPRHGAPDVARNVPDRFLRCPLERPLTQPLSLEPRPAKPPPPSLAPVAAASLLDRVTGVPSEPLAFPNVLGRPHLVTTRDDGGGAIPRPRDTPPPPMDFYPWILLTQQRTGIRATARWTTCGSSSFNPTRFEGSSRSGKLSLGCPSSSAEGDLTCRPRRFSTTNRRVARPSGLGVAPIGPASPGVRASELP